jgi:diguanylate cyclase (GGDEF)-like protein
MNKKFAETKLIAVVALLLIPIFLLGWLFVNESNKSIAFARKELLGTAFLEKFMPIYGKLVSNKPITAEDRAILANIQNDFGKSLNLSFEIDKVLSEINSPGYNRVETVEVAKHLISSLADHSNLILDPDLDTYYLMDATVLRVPELLELSSELVLKAGASIGDVQTAQGYELNLLRVGQFHETLKGLHQSMNSAITGNKDGALKFKVASESIIYQAKATEYLTLLDVNAKQMFTPSQVQARAAAQLNDFTSQSLNFWQKVTGELNALLQHRLNEFLNWLYMGIGISILFTLAAISLSMALLKKLVHKLDDKIVFLAHHDPMTRLMNRTAFNEAMHSILDLTHEKAETIAVHLIDLDKFKSINDTHGHHAGDAVLKVLANRLMENSRPEDLIGRLGGDEFVVLQRNAGTEEKAQAFANRLVGAMNEPISIDSHNLQTSISVGVALSPIHGKGAEALMVHADMALYSAKAAGRNQSVMFNSNLAAEIKARRELETEIKHAADNNLFTLNYQAQFNSTGTEIRGFEALLRLRSRGGSNISPAIFIPVAEQMGLITKIGAWVLTESCKAAINWPEHIKVAVNLSPLQFTAGGIAKSIAKVLQETGLKPSRLEVEITEGLLMKNTEDVLAELKAIRALGVSIAMDDFGAGYSSLSYLWRFPFDKIKIDRSFVKALDQNDSNAQNVLRTIVVLGHSLEMVVTAEGVETNEQANFIRELKCDQIQGFLYSRPIPEQDLAALILKSFLDAAEKPVPSEVKLRLA